MTHNIGWRVFDTQRVTTDCHRFPLILAMLAVLACSVTTLLIFNTFLLQLS